MDHGISMVIDCPWPVTMIRFMTIMDTVLFLGNHGHMYDTCHSSSCLMITPNPPKIAMFQALQNSHPPNLGPFSPCCGVSSQQLLCSACEAQGNKGVKGIPRLPMWSPSKLDEGVSPCAVDWGSCIHYSSTTVLCHFGKLTWLRGKIHERAPFIAG